jgi:hypothetical protein
MTALEAVLSLARAHGLALRSPVVLRDLSNVLVHLRPAPVVARVATSTRRRARRLVPPRRRTRGNALRTPNGPLWTDFEDERLDALLG